MEDSEGEGPRGVYFWISEYAFMVFYDYMMLRYTHAAHHDLPCTLSTR